MSELKKDNNQIIIEGLISRIRELETDVRDRDFSLKMMSEFISSHEENKLTSVQTKKLVRDFYWHTQDLCCSGLFDHIETDTDVFVELMTSSLPIKPNCSDDDIEEEPTDRFAMGTPSVDHAGENKEDK